MNKNGITLFSFFVLCCLSMHFSEAKNEGKDGFFSKAKTHAGKLGSGFVQSLKNDPATPAFLGYFFVCDRETLWSFRDAASFVGCLWLGTVIKNAYFNDWWNKRNKIVQVVGDRPVVLLPILGPLSTAIRFDNELYPPCDG